MTTTQEKLAELKQQQRDAEQAKRKLDQEIRELEEQAEKEYNEESLKTKARLENALNTDITLLKPGEAAWHPREDMTILVNMETKEMTEWWEPED